MRTGSRSRAGDSEPASASWGCCLAGFLEGHAFALFLLLLTIWFAPTLLLQQDACFTIHDNLDGEMPLEVAAANSGAYFSLAGAVPQIMNGMPRACLPTALNTTHLLFWALPPFAAYVINYLLVHTVAFLGMFVLLRSYCPSNGRLIHAGISFAFATLPFYTVYCLSVAGQPLVLYAMFNMLHGRGRRRDLLILCLFPFASSLPHVGAFVVFCGCALWAVTSWRDRTLNARFLLAMALMAAFYCLSEYQLLYALIGKSFIPHRAEYDQLSFAAGFQQSFRAAYQNFLAGQYHAASWHKPLVYIVIPLGIIAAWIARDRRKLAALLVMLGMSMVFSVLSGFQNYQGVAALRKSIPFLGIWQFGRFHWLHPILWYYAFGIATSALAALSLRGLGSGKRAAYVLVAAQILYVTWNNAEFTDTVHVFADRVAGRADDHMSYARFYSQPLFRRVAEAIPQPKETYRVVSIGLDPGVAIYNGFYTLDFYVGVYPAPYKHAFREIIAGELAKNSNWRRYYDGWGNRCYVLVDGLGLDRALKRDAVKVEHLDFNTEAFKRMGGLYVLSAAEIVNHEQNRLRCEGVFEDAGSPWRIHLYRAE